MVLLEAIFQTRPVIDAIAALRPVVARSPTVRIGQEPTFNGDIRERLLQFEGLHCSVVHHTDRGGNRSYIGLALSIQHGSI